MTESRPLKLFGTLVQVWIMLAVFLLFAYSIWALDRGFEITDEAYYLLNAMYPEAVKLFISPQHWITSELWTITGSLAGFRAIGLGILLFSVLLLALGTLQASVVCNMPVASGAGGRLAIVASTFAGAFLYGSTINYSPCYNLLATAGSYSAIGLTLMTSGRQSNWFNSVLHLLAGSSLAVVFLNKYPAGIVALALTVIVAAVLGFSNRERIIGVVLTSMGMIVTLLIVMFFQTTFSNAFKEFQLGMLFFKLVQVEPVGVRLIRYIIQFIHYIVLTTILYSLSLVSFVIYVFSRRRLIALAGIALLVAVIISQGHLHGGVSRVTSQVMPLVAILLMALFASIPVWRKNWKSIFLTGVLIILPYCVAIGTGNQLHTQIVISLASWGTLIALLAYSSNFTLQNSMPVLLLCVIFVSVAAAQVITSGYPAPYHMENSISAQTEPIKVGAIGTVRMDKETHKFVTELTEAAKRCQILPGSPFLGLYNIPGVALVIQGVPVFTPWLNGPSQAEALLNAAPLQTIRSAVVGLKLLPDGSVPQITNILPNYPMDYRLCGRAIYPYQQQVIQLWVPKDGAGKVTAGLMR